MERNLRQNGFERVVVHRAAVNDVAGSARLYLSEIGGGHLLFDHNVQGGLAEWVEVPTVTLEQIMEDERLESIDFLKLDCEGAEGAILETTPRTCLRRVRQIAMEFHDNVSRLDHRAMEALLQDAGFRTQLRWNGRSPFGYLYAWQPR
ncbi:MAG: FkbM family methyltransferase [Gemmatimonadota bacterium]|jgi:FkbM family methyltransferase|nr:FkbM family methyltransferase [Gemmatimonadota bacterium]MDQ3605037.1 FkbM family methyltransferase [Gemmatimonadota bacterium]